MSRRRYPSDLSEARWRLVQEFLQEPPRPGRQRTTDLREVVNAINYRWITGCAWRMLPHDFPAWETVYTYFARWREQGRLPLLRELLLRKSPYAAFRKVRADWPSRASMDAPAAARQHQSSSPPEWTRDQRAPNGTHHGLKNSPQGQPPR